MISRLIFPSKFHLILPHPFGCNQRLTASSTIFRFGHYFSTTRSHYDNSFINHYDVLKVPQSCSQAELKKQFYTLSRQTHPDVNKTDPDASARFSQISESYSILADPDRRKRYDRDVLRVHQQQHQSRPASAGGAARSGSYAGSRPASGLSKRRGIFRGPPPSFYAHGGKDPPRPNTTSNPTSAGTGTASTSSAGPGPDFTPPPNANFDPQPIHRTQTHEDTRRQSRREAAMARAQKEMEDDAGFWVRFVVVTGMLVGGVSVAGVFLGMGGGVGGRKKGGLVRGDGSRRDGSGNGGNGNGNEWAKSGALMGR